MMLEIAIYTFFIGVASMNFVLSYILVFTDKKVLTYFCTYISGFFLMYGATKAASVFYQFIIG